MKIATGSTPAGDTDWIQYPPHGIYVDIDTSAAGFTRTPVYITSIDGEGFHWTTKGASSIYKASSTGFRIYIWKDTLEDGADLTPEYANDDLRKAIGVVPGRIGGDDGCH